VLTHYTLVVDCICHLSRLNLLANPISVAEHIDYVVTAEKKLKALASAQGLLDSLKDLDD
jgi:hypothetical protein